MLERKYGLKYSMPHSVVHIIDNSMYKGQLPVTVVDDPSLYATIVVSGAPMGADNEMISINRSDVLNVAYGMSDISANDIKKYGQSITYPGSLLSQDVPVKFMRVTPDDATYAFSCLLMEWRWDDSAGTMHVRFKTTEDEGNGGLPGGMILSSFKNPARLNAALVKGFYQNNVDGSGWTRRVLLTEISAGRGSEYNKFNYAINQTQQSKRPANVRYAFATINTSTSQTVERVYASLVNESNSNRTDAIDTVNVQVGRRVKGSSILIPTVNESAVKEFYAEYMLHFKEMLDAGILPASGSMEFAETVFKTITVNTFDPIYGRYVYNGDTDVLLPYFQVDMYNLDIPQLSTANRIKAILDGSVTIDQYVANPTDLQTVLKEKTKGVENSSSTDYVHVGDVYLTNTTTLNIAMVTSINQYTGTVTTIPITKIYTDLSDRTDAKEDVIRTYVSVDEVDAGKIKTAVQELVDRRKLIPRLDTAGRTDDDHTTPYTPDYVIVGITDEAQKNTVTNLNTFILAKIEYVPRSDDNPSATPQVGTSTPINDKADIYKSFVYPKTTVSMFATNKPSESKKPNEVYWYTPGATIINVNDVAGLTSGGVYVNSYDVSEANGASEAKESYDRLEVTNTKPFMIGVYPTFIRANENIVGTSYDCLIYSNSGSSTNVTWVLRGGSYTGTTTETDPTKVYVVGDIVSITAGGQTYKFEVKAVDGANITVDLIGTPATTTTAIEATAYDTTYVSGPESRDPAGPPEGLKINVTTENIIIDTNGNPSMIKRYVVNGTMGSLFRYAADPTNIPADYYEESYGINPNSEMGGIAVKNGYAGFFDDNLSDIEFKWRYSELLVKAFRGEKDPRINSPTRCPAKYLFDGAMNTIVGQTILPYVNYKPIDVINASTIFTDDEKEAILLDNSIISNIKEFADIDVKQAMYDLMVIRCYHNIPEEKRPIGPGSGLSLFLDSGVTDINTAKLVNTSFNKRFDNPNASWDIGGYTSATDGIAYTYTKAIVDNLFNHMKTYSVNKPYTGKYTNIAPEQYLSFFPDLDTTDWELRELMYKSGGNAWMVDVNGNLQRKSQRTLYREGDTSDLIQESNMRTLSQLVYILQNKIDTYLLEYNDDGVLKTLKDEVDNLFSNWVGNLVQALDITFERDINPDDGGEIVVCYCNVTFRGLILRVPIIVNVQRRTDSE